MFKILVILCGISPLIFAQGFELERSEKSIRRQKEKDDMRAAWARGETLGWRGVEPGALSSVKLPHCLDSEPTEYTKIPEEFDGRTEWKHCPSLWEIRSQGRCLSCWAVTIASVLTDRYCIHSNGTKNFRFSEEDFVSCGTAATRWDSNSKLDGCDGGNLEKAWLYLQNNTGGENLGIVSGGSYKSTQGCRSYSIVPCIDNFPTTDKRSCQYPKIEEPPNTPACEKKCSESYKGSYEEDRKFISSACSIPWGDINPVRWIQNEIIKNGPVAAKMIMYQSWADFNPQNDDDVFVGNSMRFANYYHAVKIVGWGISKVRLSKKYPKGTKYWIVANSYSGAWGQRGFFKILMDEKDEDDQKNNGINREVTAGIPIIT